MSELNLAHKTVSWLRNCGADVQRIEDKLATGVPDINFCLNGKEAWIELKHATIPVRKATPIKVSFRPFQLPWMRQRQAHGGRCYVLVSVTGNTLLFGYMTIVTDFLDGTYTYAALQEQALSEGSFDSVMNYLIQET